MTYVHDTVFLRFVATKTSIDQFHVHPMAKIFFIF